MAKPLKLSMPGRRFVIGVPYVWLLIFFFLPFLILLYISFGDMGNEIHPFQPLWDPQQGVLLLKFANYWSIFRAGPDGAAGAPRLPVKENPVGVAVYGQICLAAKSYQSAICAWSRVAA